MNKRQKEFRKQIKKIEKKKRKEGVEEPYSYLNENYRPNTHKKGRKRLLVLLMVGVLIFSVLYLVNKTVNEKDDTLQVNAESWNVTDIEVHSYMEKTQEIDKQLRDTWNAFSSKEEYSKMSLDDMKSAKKKIEGLSKIAQSNKQEFQDLSNFYKEQINLTGLMIDSNIDNKTDSSIKNAFKSNKIRNSYNENQLKQQFIVMEILKTQGMSFNLNEDGSLYYEYEKHQPTLK